ncbi:hypothetical protein R3P38DRAFT_2824256 [Favolaschia claudopus]|uniref:Uncharacterized protein n=1 Tax=Favolaschia claudopus TaxID=2862362 RepID=A0AAW0EJW1_9AGAR
MGLRIASPTWQLSPTRTAAASQSTVFSDPQLLAPRVTPSPTCCEPNEVAIEISTTILIPDYLRFYPGPITQFRPVYSALPDGSLIALPYTHDLAKSHLSLLVAAMLAALFLRNIIVALDYLRRARMKRKVLFYLLLCSQFLAFGLAPLLGSFFSTHLDCTAVVAVASGATGVSLALLMTGVLGLKAYRCLDSSRFVLFVLVAFFCASSGILGLQLVNAHGALRLSGGCASASRNPRFIRIYVLIQLAHSAFLCCCFFYAVWKSRSSPAARGRISVAVSLDDFPNVQSDKPIRRGWWEQLLGRDNTPSTPTALVTSAGTPLHSASNRRGSQEEASRRASCSPLAPPIQGSKELSAPYQTPTPLSRLIPRMELFHRVMKDELCYTTTITVTTFILAVLLVLGVNFQNNLDMTGWVSANWAIISVLVIHSFGRVIRRHEQEALFQHPSAWWHERDMSHRSPYSGLVFSGSPLRIQVPEDPFSDARAIRQSMSSWNSEFAFSPSSPSPVATRDRNSTTSFSSGRTKLLESFPSAGGGSNRAHPPAASSVEKSV